MAPQFMSVAVAASQILDVIDSRPETDRQFIGMYI